MPALHPRSQAQAGSVCMGIGVDVTEPAAVSGLSRAAFARSFQRGAYAREVRLSSLGTWSVCKGQTEPLLRRDADVCHSQDRWIHSRQRITRDQKTVVGGRVNCERSDIRAAIRVLAARTGAPTRAQQSNTDQQMSFRNRWSPSTSSRIASGSWSRCHWHSSRPAASPSPSGAAARAALIA